VPGESVVVTPEGTTGLTQQFEVDHIMENLTAKATNWIEANREEPFFVYFAANAVHGPIAPNPRFNASRYDPSATSSRNSTGAWADCSTRSVKPLSRTSVPHPARHSLLSYTL